MKKLLILAFIIIAKCAFAQKDTVGLNVPFVNNTVVYEKVFDVPNAPQNMLYSNAGLWLAETHPYVVNTQLQLVDPALSRVVGRVTSATVYTYKALLSTNYVTLTYSFTLQIDCKDNKYRIRIYNIQQKTDTIYTPIDDMMLALIKSKSYNSNIGIMNVQDLQQRFISLNIVISDTMADITKSMLTDTSFK